MRSEFVLIGAGGTIASRHDPPQGRIVASQSGEGLVVRVPRPARASALESAGFATVSSFDMSSSIACPGASIRSWRSTTSPAWS